MSRHLFWNSCTVEGRFKNPCNTFFFKELRDSRYFQLLKHFHSATFCWFNGLFIFFLTGCSEKSYMICFGMENLKSAREEEN